MQLLVTKALAAGFAASMAIGGNTTAQMPNTVSSSAASYQDSRTITAFESLTPLGVWIDKLIDLESEGKTNLKILDLNGLHSFGCLQFQMGTFREFGLKYKFFSEDDDLNKLIFDCKLQKEIAQRMIRDNPENWKKWYTSVVVRGLGFPPKDPKPILVSFNGR